MISARFFSPPEKPTLTGPLQHVRGDVELLGDALHQLHELGRRQLAQALRFAMRVERRLEEGHGGDAGDLDRILEGEEQARHRALVRLQVEDRCAVQQHLTLGDLVIVLAGENVGERRLAGAVRPHDGVHFAGLHRQGETLQDLAVANPCVKVLDLEHGSVLSSVWPRRAWRRLVVVGHEERRVSRCARLDQPTLPSRLMPISFCVSTMNSIGSCCSTSFTKPLTIRAMASSCGNPRCRQ